MALDCSNVTAGIPGDSLSVLGDFNSSDHPEIDFLVGYYGENATLKAHLIAACI